MKNNHEKFLEKYFAENDRATQLGMMKEYMLALSPEELKTFIKDQLEHLKKALLDPNVSEEMKNKIDNGLGEMAFLLKSKQATA